MIGKIERLPLRNVWKHEALDLTTWLQENIDVLNDALDLNLANPEREQSAGAFNVDIVAEDESGAPVIIENQLEKSDHDHLGKLITYLVALGGQTAVWIVSEPRPEHIAAVSWLNESTSCNFYLAKIEAIKIGDSPPAPLLTAIVRPSEEGKEVGKVKKEISERYIIREKFWRGLLEVARAWTKLHSNISPSMHNWIGASAGKSGLNFNYVIRKHEAQVELYIDRGKERATENRHIFDHLYKHKEEVEKTFGGKLEWESLEGKRACRISKKIKVGGYRNDEDEWPKIHETMAETMARFEQALKPHIAKLRI